MMMMSMSPFGPVSCGRHLKGTRRIHVNHTSIHVNSRQSHVNSRQSHALFIEVFWQTIEVKVEYTPLPYILVG
jgi:hypothetical protein